MTERPKLTGTVYGSKREAMIAEIKSKAAVYFETNCIIVELSNERAHPILPGINADFIAFEWHNIRYPSYGFGKCLNCDREKNSINDLPGPKDPRDRR